jgi:hypothetical protein
MPKIKTKEDVKNWLLKHPGIVSYGIDLDSAVMADGLVTLVSEQDLKRTGAGEYFVTGEYFIRVVGWPSEPEKNITTVKEAVDYIWANRKRIYYE